MLISGSPNSAKNNNTQVSLRILQSNCVLARKCCILFRAAQSGFRNKEKNKSKQTRRLLTKG